MKITPRLASFFRTSQSSIALAVLASVSFTSSASAADFVWNQTDATNDWSLDSNWTPTAAVGGPSAAGTSVLINTNVGGNSTINLYTTGNPGTATKTIGLMDIGDTNGTHSYTIATGTGAGILNFDGNGSTAQLNELGTSKGDVISAPVTLSSSLDISNASANTLTLSTGGITSATAGTKTLRTTTGLVTLSGIVGDGSGAVAVVQDGAGTLTLSGTNSFTGGLTLRNGTVLAGANASALGGTGTGAVTIGAGSGTANATLLTSASSSQTFANPITVAAGGTGLYMIGNSGSTVSQFSGAITLNNNLTIAENNTNASGFSIAQYMLISGGISGSGNLTLAGNGAVSTGNDGGKSLRNGILISGPVSTTGGIINSGTGKALVQISGAISNAAGGVTQDSATSRLTLSSANTYTGATNVNAGVLRITNSTAISTSSAVNVAAGATLQFTGNAASPNTAQILTLSGHGTDYSSGALESVTTGAYLGNVVLAADTTFAGSFANNTLTVGTVAVTTITGSGKNLTTTGPGSVTLSGSLDTGAGSLTKTGTGLLTLSGANSFTGLTSINQGTVVLNNSTALGGGGSITFGGGSLRYTAANNVDYSSRIINSTGPISIDTGGQNRTLSGGFAASNTGGLTKIGSGTLTLSGTNSYTGATIVSGGQLAISDTGALPSTIFTDVTGAVNQGGAYAGVQGWLGSGKVAAGSVGAIALTGNSSENIDFTGYINLMLGASTNLTYTGTITPAGGVYRLGGGSGTITLTNINAVTGANALVVGARSGTGSSGGGVTLGAANDLTGTTTVASSTLTMNSGTAGLATSDVTVNGGATLAINYASGNLSGDNSVIRAKSVRLNGSTLNISGNIGGNTTETITNALTFASGQSTVNISPATGKHALLNAGSFARTGGSTALFTGTSLGVNANSSTNISSANVSFGGGGPTLNGAGTAGGAGGTTTVGILAGAYGDTVHAGTGLGATGGLVTYDATNGVRLLAAGEYKTSITDGQTALDNIRLSSTGGATVTTTLNSDTIINSLSILTSTSGSSVSVAGSGKLTLNSGVIHASAPTGTVNGVGNAIDFNGNEAIVLSNSASGENLNLSGILSNTGGNGLTKSGSGTLRLSGTAANTYTGATTVNGGILNLSKTAGLNAINGDLVINNSGTQVTLGSSNQIADTSNITVNGALFVLASSTGNNGGASETINNLTMINGGNLNYGQAPSGPTFAVNGTATVSGGSTLFQNDGGQLLIGGLTSLSDGGTLIVKAAFSPTNIYDGSVTLTGGLNITNTATGTYTPVTINAGEGSFRNGGLLTLGGDLTFTGNTNPNTVTIAAPAGTGPQGVMALSGDRTFAIGDGSATVDLTVGAAVVDGSTPGGLVKTGAGTLALTASNAYSGNTTVSGGVLSLSKATLSDAGRVDIATSASLNLAHGLTDTVDSFYINGVQQASGVWGAVGSGAAHQTDRITGSGRLNVTTGAASSDPFVAWIDSFTSLTNPADKTRSADPDKDGQSNYVEFALDGNPASGTASGKVRSRIETVGADQALVITLPVRAGAVFDNLPGPAADATIENLIYTIAGTNDLAAFDQGVSEIPVSASGMPALSGASWTYRTFRLNGAVGGGTPRGPKGFLRAAITSTP